MSWDEYHTWLSYGLKRGWVSDPFCATHDMGPWSDEEIRELDEGYDPCMPTVRLYGMETVFPDDMEYTDAQSFKEMLREY